MPEDNRESEIAPDWHRQVIESMGSGVIALDGDGRVVSANPAALEYLALSEKDLKPGCRFEDLPAAAPLAAVVQDIQSTGESFTRQEITIPTAAGSREIGFSAMPIRSAKGLGGVVLVFTDLTERRKMEHAAELNRQLAALGELTAGVVHELRNPLSVISGMAELLMRRLEPDDRRHKAARMILEEAVSMEKSVAQFLGFARPYDVVPAPCNPEEILSKAYKLCRNRAQQKGVTLVCKPDPDLGALRADAGRTAQAVVNLINNGIDAAGSGGTVGMGARRDENEMVFTVTDTGAGVHLEEGEDLFKPFFTQKEAGTGLGLAIVHRIITAHEGTVSYANRAEGGASFEIRLPIE
jgi:PAS domain S-box-containing protein